MKDLSSLAADSMWVTSQAAGNMTSSNDRATGAKGSEPVDPLPDRDKQGDPSVTLPSSLPVGTPPRRMDPSYNPSAVSWKKTVDGNA